MIINIVDGCLRWPEMIIGNCLCMSALALKITLGKYGRSGGVFGFFVQLCLALLCNEDFRRCWKRFKGIFSDRELWP